MDDSNAVKGVAPGSHLEHPQPWAGPAVSSINCGVSYKPLRLEQSIRLLKFQSPCDTASPKIECTLTERSMGDCHGKYVALSYT